MQLQKKARRCYANSHSWMSHNWATDWVCMRTQSWRKRCGMRSLTQMRMHLDATYVNSTGLQLKGLLSYCKSDLLSIIRMYCINSIKCDCKEVVCTRGDFHVIRYCMAFNAVQYGVIKNGRTTNCKGFHLCKMVFKIRMTAEWFIFVPPSFIINHSFH